MRCWQVEASAALDSPILLESKLGWQQGAAPRSNPRHGNEESQGELRVESEAVLAGVAGKPVSVASAPISGGALVLCRQSNWFQGSCSLPRGRCRCF
jgi:hypothetical protein